MTKGIYLMALLVFAISTSAKAQDGKVNFDYGRVENSTYVNTYFDFKFDLPTNWAVQSREEVEDLAKRGKEFVAGDDENLNAIVKASEVNTANLLMVFQYEQGTAVDYNPSIMVVAENVKSTKGIKKGSDYLFHSRKFLEQSQFKYDYLDKEFEKEVIGGADFYKMRAGANYLGMDIKQIYYATILKGFSLNVIISYVEEEHKEKLLNAVKSMKFGL